MKLCPPNEFCSGRSGLGLTSDRAGDVGAAFSSLVILLTFPHIVGTATQ